MKHGKPVLQSIRLLDQVRERIRYLHYSLSTEKVYLCWVRFFVLWHGRTARMMHPRDMGAKEWSALSALPFLYREVLDIDLPWLTEINRPTPDPAHSFGADQRRGSWPFGRDGRRNRATGAFAIRHRNAADGRHAPARERP